MLGKKKFILIIVAIFLVNYLLIYLKRLPPTETRHENVEEPIMMPVASTSAKGLSPEASKEAVQNFQLPVLVMACNRVIIKRCLDSILRARNGDTRFPIYVSQDCIDKDTENVIKEYEGIFYMKQPNQTDPDLGKKKKLKGYFRISRHYRWALNQVFSRGYIACIVIEDDLEVSPDIFEYFLATLPILQRDSYLYCVSAWNDNGKAKLINPEKPGLIYRTDFFPGLGWMLLKKHWLEFEPQWPDAFWDDWMRTPSVRKNRSCLRPEISRTETFGRKGVSNGLHFTTHLQHIKKYDKFYPFRNESFSYLYVDEYEDHFLRRAYSSKEYDHVQITKMKIPEAETSVRITYKSKETFKGVALVFGIMADFKSGIPRTAYRGVVPFQYKSLVVYLCPPYDWPGYNASWT